MKLAQRLEIIIVFNKELQNIASHIHEKSKIPFSYMLYLFCKRAFRGTKPKESLRALDVYYKVDYMYFYSCVAILKVMQGIS